MTPASPILYAITLFSALYSLLLWSNRRNRVARHYRARVAADLLRGDESQD
jgi:hypothetical protein